jgi:hypothetical protein
MRLGQVSQVEEERRSLSGLRARIYALTHHSRNLLSPRTTGSRIATATVRAASESGDAPASSRFRVGGGIAVEASRKHGPFDTRSPGVRRDDSGAVPASLLSAAEAAEALEWDAFSDRYFRDRRRHDSEARSAYAAYKQGREWRTTQARLWLVPTERVAAAGEPEPEEAGTRRLLAALAGDQLQRRSDPWQ